jgi:hypothetical protein
MISTSSQLHISLLVKLLPSVDYRTQSVGWYSCFQDCERELGKIKVHDVLLGIFPPSGTISCFQRTRKCIRVFLDEALP